jgi:hypothetical protein
MSGRDAKKVAPNDARPNPAPPVAHIAVRERAQHCPQRVQKGAKLTKLSAMRWWIFACLALGCGSEGTNDADSGMNGSGTTTGTSVGSGTVEGDMSIDVVTAKFRDPGPFNGKSRVEVTLSSSAACGRLPSCSEYTELVLKLSAEGEISAGPYELINPAEGSLIVEWVTVQSDGAGCRVGGQPAVRGSVNLESVTPAELVGSFDMQILWVDGTEPVVTGQFAALQCP